MDESSKVDESLLIDDDLVPLFGRRCHSTTELPQNWLQKLENVSRAGIYFVRELKTSILGRMQSAGSYPLKYNTNNNDDVDELPINCVQPNQDSVNFVNHLYGLDDPFHDETPDLFFSSPLVSANSKPYGDENISNNPSNSSPSHLINKTTFGVFGYPIKNSLYDVFGHLAYSVPPVVTETVGYIKRHGLKQANLFTKPGNFIALSKYIRMYDEYKIVALDMEPDVNTITDLLKTYLIRIPESLLGNGQLEICQSNAIKRLSFSTLEKKMELLLIQLPEVNLLILDSLFKLLKEVERYSLANLMDEKRLAAVFVPILNINEELFNFFIRGDPCSSIFDRVINTLNTEQENRSATTSEKDNLSTDQVINW